jgi:hypothetical protein
MKEFFLNILIIYFCLFEHLTTWVEIAGEDFGDSAKAPGTFFGLPLFFRLILDAYIIICIIIFIIIIYRNPLLLKIHLYSLRFLKNVHVYLTIYICPCIQYAGYVTPVKS